LSKHLKLPSLFFRKLSNVVNSSERKQKVVVLRELQRAITYTTKISKQIKKSYVRNTVHMYLVN
jgi:hypothetical protein